MRLPHDDLSTRVEHSTGRVLSRSLEAFPAQMRSSLGEQCFGLPPSLLRAFLWPLVTIAPLSCRRDRPRTFGGWRGFQKSAS
jgi:hypothetical protein